MRTLTSLTCPNCGGRLVRTPTPSILVCLYCGVEHYAADVSNVEDAGPRLHGTIRVRLTDGMAVPLIAQGARLPTEVRQSFSTTKDNQLRLDVTLVFGEHQLTRDNVLLGTFALDNLKPAPRGVPTLDLCLSVDEQKHLLVTATEVSAKRSEVIGHADLSGLLPSPPPLGRVGP